MLRAASLIVLGALTASPATAAGWMSCSDSGGLASFDYFIADQADFNVTAVTVTASERVWASDPANGPGDPIYVGQFYDDPTGTLVDAIDEVFNKVAELKLFKAVEADAIAYGGTLRIVDVGAWAVSCSPSEF
jgi:hypothetical protein